MNTLKVIDSHTGGMPTRIIVQGGPDLGTGSLAERRDRLRDDYDYIRTAAIKEPRGCDHLIGGLLCEPVDSSCAAGIIFFEGASYLGMCGHGTIGLVATLKHMSKIDYGVNRLETPIGIISTHLREDGLVTIENVPSFRLTTNIEVDVPDYGRVRGDVVWGGNWFFVVRELPKTERLSIAQIRRLTQVTLDIRRALAEQGVTGSNGAPVNQVEIFSAPESSENQSRNFVLCPGGYYDRSPCGTGTSAKIACLAADGDLLAGSIWRQESIVGSVFECSYRSADQNGQVIPIISGKAYVTSESTLVQYSDDPFRVGIG